MGQWNGESGLLGRVVGGYRLERLLRADGGFSLFQAALAAGDGAAQALVTVYPLPAPAEPEAQVEARARFQRALEIARQSGSVLATGEDGVAGVLYLVTPAQEPVSPATPSSTGSFVAPPPGYPVNAGYGGPAGGPGAPVYPQGTYPPPGYTPFGGGYAPVAAPARRSGLRLALAALVIGVACVTLCGIGVGGAAFFVAARDALGVYPLRGSTVGVYPAASGCAVPGASVDATYAPPAAALPQSRQVLRVESVGDDVTTLDPPNAYDPVSQQYAALVFPGLLALDHNQCVIPWAARALPEVSADGLTYTFRLRPGLKWSDGVPITSQTFAYSINRAADPCYSFNDAYYLDDIQDAWDFNAETCDPANHHITGDIQTLIGDSLLTPDPLTLQVVLDSPLVYFPTEFAYSASYAVPQQLIQRYGGDYLPHLADGAGFGGNLFKVTAWDHHGLLRLTRNEAFWGTKPVLREVDVRFTADANAAYRAYLAGQADVASAPASQLAQARRHAGFHQVPAQTIAYYGMNWKTAPFDDRGMRQAFALALDKSALAKIGSGGTALATNHIVPLGAPGYNPALTGPDGTQGLRGDLALANRLATAYATRTGCGTATDFSRCPLVTLDITNDPAVMAQAEAARVMWQKAAPQYPILIATYSLSTLYDVLSNDNPQIWGLSWVGDYPDPADWLSNNLGCYGGYNYGNICDKAADTLLNNAGANTDRTQRLAQYQQAEQMLVNDVGWIPLDQPAIWWETRATIHNYAITSTGLTPEDLWQAIYLSAR